MALVHFDSRFSKWTQAHAQRLNRWFIWLTAMAGGLTFASPLVDNIKAIKGYTPLATATLHLILVTGAFFYLASSQYAIPKRLVEDDRLDNAVKGYHLCWIAVCGVWVVQYTLMLMREMHAPVPSWLNEGATLNLLNRMVLPAYVAMYLVLAVRWKRSLFIVTTMTGVLFVIIAFVMDAGLHERRDWLETQLRSAGAELKSHSVASVSTSSNAEVQTLADAHRGYVADIRFVQIVSSIVECLFLVMIAGRLDSKLLNPPVFVLIAVYLYGPLQILFAFVTPESIQSIMVYLLFFAMLLKAIAVMFAVWLLRSGALALFLSQTCDLSNQSDSELIAAEQSAWSRNLWAIQRNPNFPAAPSAGVGSAE